MQTIRSLDDIAIGLDHLARTDARLVPIIEEAGPLPLRLQPGGFEGLASIIVSQMVSRQSADAIWKRLSALSPNGLEAGTLLNINESDFRAAGLSGGKISTLVASANAVVSGLLDLSDLGALDGTDAIARMTAIKGIGPWTAEVYLMFCCGHADLFPVGDVALRAAVTHALDLPQRIEARSLAEAARIWAPWRSVAARLFWAYYARHMGRSGLPVA